MADSTINGLTALTGANVDNTADQLAIWDNSANTTKKITRTEVLTGISAGTAAAPAISPTGDSNTGLYFPAADTFGLVTGGSERLRIDSAGQVGIGKTPTLGLLDVNADAYFNTVRVGLGGGAVSTNTAVGNGAMAATATGGFNTAFGQSCLTSLTSGTSNTAIGRSVLSSVVSGANNTGLGFEALKVNTASDNTAVGYQALTANTSGTNNVAVGRSALTANQTGSANIAIGYGALNVNTASDNTAVGYSSLGANTSGTDNVAVGRSALAFNVTANNNTAIGRSALSANTASDNTAVGALALQANTSGTSNVAVGRSAGALITTGSRNVFVGRGSGDAIVSNSDNTAVGDQSLSAAAGSGNAALGSSALQSATGSNNTGLGYGAGDVITTGADNTIIGALADPSANNGTGQIVIGKGVTGTANNRITVGINANIAELDLDGVDTSWAASSDERLKKNVADYAAGLDVITALRPVTYQWRSRKEVPTELTNYYADSDEPVHGDASKTYHGFIAQEVKAVLDANPSVPNGQHLWEQRDDGVQTLAPADLVPILVNAIKQLHAEVQALKNK